MGQGTFLGIDTETDQTAGPALATVKEFPVRRDVQIGRGRLLLVATRRCRLEELQLLQRAAVLVDRIGADRRGGLGDQVEKPPVRVDRQDRKSTRLNSSHRT